jgi:hypothetical protein
MNQASEVAKSQRIAKALNAKKSENGKGEPKPIPAKARKS